MVERIGSYLGTSFPLFYVLTALAESRNMTEIISSESRQQHRDDQEAPQLSAAYYFCRVSRHAPDCLTTYCQGVDYLE